MFQEDHDILIDKRIKENEKEDLVALEQPSQDSLGLERSLNDFETIKISDCVF